MTKHSLRLFAFMLLGIPAVWAAPGTSDRVVAIVNDQIITAHSWQNACTLAERETSTPLTSNQRNILCNRTLSNLIDQELQRQYATRVGLSLSKDELAEAKKIAERQGAFGKGGFAAYAKGLPQAAEDRFEADLLWQKILAEVVRPNVTITNAEVDQLINEMVKRRHVTEREISQILISVDDPAKDKQAQEKLLDIQKRLKAGESFATLAHTQSDDSSSAKGGNMGWFSTGELNPQLEEALDKMKAGEVSEPIRTPLGWHLIRLDNTRETTPISTAPEHQVQITVIAAPAPSDTTALKALRKQLNTLRKDLDDAAAVSAFVNKDDTQKTFPASHAYDFSTLKELPTSFQQTAASLKPGQFSGVLETPEKTLAIVYMAGERTVMPKELESYRNRIREHLLQSRMELGARKLMRELRQRAFVDIRD